MDGEVLAVRSKDLANRLRRYVFSEVHYLSLKSSDLGDRCVSSSIASQDAKAQNVQTSTKSDIKLESLILAQNERWRQA